MIELKIQGMSCMHCVKAVTEALSQVPGVTAVQGVSLERGAATVEGFPDKAFRTAKPWWPRSKRPAIRPRCAGDERRRASPAARHSVPSQLA